MRNTYMYFIVTSLSLCLMLSACKTSKKSTASTNSKDIKVKKVDQRKSKVAKNKVVAPDTAMAETNTYSIVNKPPQPVLDAFKLNYPAVATVAWAETFPVNPVTSVSQRNHKAFFLLNENKNWVTYDNAGLLVETQEQILPDQLPPSIFWAIKKKYPDMSVLAASMIKNVKTGTTYLALISPNPVDMQKEVLLNENGAFIKE